MDKKEKVLKEIKSKAKKRKYIIIGVAVLIIAVIVFASNDGEEQEHVVAERGNLTQELFETGSTEKGEEVTLSFKEGGKIESVFVKEGEEVKGGDAVAALDKGDLRISLREAEAALSSARASFERFLSGATREEIEVARAAVQSAEAGLNSAKDNLSEQEKIAEETLKDVHQGTATTLGTVSLLGETYSSVNEIKMGVARIARQYFTGIVVSETTSGRRSRDVIRRSSEEIEKYKDMATKEEVDFKEKEDALRKTEKELRVIIGELDNLVDVVESDFYKDTVAEADKSLIRTYRRTANSALNDVSSLLRRISSVNVEISAKLTSARGQVDSARTALNQAERELSRIKADPESADVRAKEAAVDQARARVEALQKRITDATLRTPVAGTVSDVLMRGGEVAGAGSPVAVIIPEEEMQITLDIYEGDIANVQVGDRAMASFVAFPDREFPGQVVFVNPAGRVIDGVVYYNVKVMLDEYPEGVLPQMTVDVTIRTGEKEDVIILPERAIYRREGKRFVRVLENGEHVEREVEVGLRGERRMVEIISGIREGEKVLVE